jgi:hypothetical protein
MMRRTNQSGQALLSTVIVMSLLLLALLTVLTQVQVGNRLIGRQLTYQGQAINAAEAGLADGLSWFRRQTVQPVRNFVPIVNASTNPPTNDSEDPSIGIVRTYQISAPGRLMGRYEVRIGDPTKGIGVLDITQQKGKTSSSPGTVWQLESVGYVWVQNDNTKAYNVDPNVIISTQTARTEIQKLGVNLPDGGAALFSAQCGPVNVTSRTKVQGGQGIGVSCRNGSGLITNNGVVTGATPIKQNSVAPYDVQAVFSVTTQELLGLADVNVTSVNQLPANLPSMSLIVVRGNANFTAARPLVGSGIMVVFGNLNVAMNSNASFSGVIYVTGTVNIGEPSLISGALICANNAASGNSVVLNSSSDVVEVDYDPSMITQINQQMGQYRYSRSKYWVGK